MKTSLLSVFFILFSGFLIAQNRDLNYYIEQAKANSPLINKNINENKLIQLNLQQVNRILSRPVVNVEADVLFAPIISHDNNSNRFGWVSAGANDYTGYDLAISNGGQYQALCNMLKKPTHKSPNLSNLETLANFIQEGGIPEYLKQKSISQKQADDFIRSVLNTIIEKDIFQRLNITNKHDFHKIVDFVFDSVGSYVSPRSISDTLRSHGTVVDKQTVAKYLDALCDVFLIYKVPRFEIKGKGLLQTLNKYYLVDPCFRKVRLKREMVRDRSYWLENAVYLELVRRYRDVYIGKKGNLEVDFVVTDHQGYTSYYQVSWTTENTDTLQRELASLRAIKDSNPKYLLTTDIDFNPTYDGIRKLNIVDWLLAVENH